MKSIVTFAIRLGKNKTKWPVRLGVRTPGFHPGNRGSIPLGTANKKTHHMMGFLFYF